MHHRPLALGIAALVGAAGITGCGSSGDDAATAAAAEAPTTTATVPDGKLAASAAPPRLGIYAGVDCGSASGTLCDQAAEHGREGYTVHCRGGHPVQDSHSSFTRGGHEFNFVCFTLRTSNDLEDFSYAGKRIVRAVHVSADRFHETCDNGWCISGEWSSTRRVSGTVRNPTSVRAGYRAEWISMR